MENHTDSKGVKLGSDPHSQTFFHSMSSKRRVEESNSTPFGAISLAKSLSATLNNSPYKAVFCSLYI